MGKSKSSKSGSKSKSSGKSGTKVARGSRSTTKSAMPTTRVKARNLVPGDGFMMNGQKPAVVVDSHTWKSLTTESTMTNVVLRRADGGFLMKTYDPNDSVMIQKNDRLDESREVVSSANMRAV